VRLIEFANKNRLPAIYESTGAEAGGLTSYRTDRDYIWRRFAIYVDKILKGAKVGGSAGRATDEVRIRNQSESGQADRSDDSAVSSLPRRLIK
jgi:ABC-type uncharacterized transport system substrate-binding protein